MANPQDELSERDRLELMSGAAKTTGAVILVLKEDEMELFRTDAELLISIDPIFVGFFSALELLLTLALYVYLSLKYLAILCLSQWILEFVLNLCEYSLKI